MSRKRRYEFGYKAKQLTLLEQQADARARKREIEATLMLEVAYPEEHQETRRPNKTGYSKAERRAWWNNLTPEQQQAYIERKQAEKSQRRAESDYQSPCPDFPEINDTNRADWQAKIKRLNPWVQIRQIA